jgi:hypothetical protein
MISLTNISSDFYRIVLSERSPVWYCTGICAGVCNYMCQLYGLSRLPNVIIVIIKLNWNPFKSAWSWAIEWAIAHRCRMSAEGGEVVVEVGSFLRTLALTSFLCVWVSDFQFCSTALPAGASVFIVRRHSLPKSTAWKRSVGLNLALVRENDWAGSIRSSQSFVHSKWSSHKEDERE